MSRSFEESTLIHAPLDRVWDALTRIERMREWMGDAEVALEIDTDWVVGHPILMRGFHHAWFENRGVILAFEPLTRLRYTHLSSLSQLPDVPESYTTLEFALNPAADGTALVVTASNFPTDSIFQHLRFYWRGTLTVLKQQLER